MLLLYCQHWHFNSVIENYISRKLVCTVAYCLMTMINQASSFQSRFLYSKPSYCLLHCGLAGGYSCCFHFSELVTRQSFNWFDFFSFRWVRFRSIAELNRTQSTDWVRSSSIEFDWNLVRLGSIYYAGYRVNREISKVCLQIIFVCGSETVFLEWVRKNTRR